MKNEVINDLVSGFGFQLPNEGVTAALVLALFSTWVVVGLFGYLNRYTKRKYFHLWTVAWMYYSLYLAASIGLEETHATPFLVMSRRACIGISALCMFWGSFHLAKNKRYIRELGLAMVMILVWSYVAAYHVGDRYWITIPVFLLLSIASAYTGKLYFERRKQYRAALILCVGFCLWGFHLFAFPFQGLLTPEILVGVYLTTAALALFIAMGMLMLVLEEARERNELLRGEFKKGQAKSRLLKHEAAMSEEKYRALFTAASDGIFLVDLESLRIREVNEAAAQLLNRTVEELIGRKILDLCPALRPEGDGLLGRKRMFETVFNGPREFSMLRNDGGHVLCEGAARMVEYEHRPVMQINIRELTERKKMEQRLRQTEKLSALGQLVAGVAHELNNPLAVIMGHAQLIGQRKDLDERLRREMTAITRESERAARLVRNLLRFARPRDVEVISVLDINKLVGDVLEICSSSLRAASVNVERDLHPALPTALGDMGQIEQVLTNLVTNAIHALSDHRGSRILRVTTAPVGENVRIAVRDSGPGIPEGIAGKIFEPFFTTKGPGKGTGLGLSLSYGIIESHQGKIWMESQSGKGATFFVELPAHEKPAEAVKPVVEPPKARAQKVSAPEQQHRVLVVDDEPGIIEILSAILVTNGYAVETAPHGAEAMQRLWEKSYDLIISDLCMPEMNGEEFYRAVGETFPDMRDRIVFLTGDTVSPHSRAFLDRVGNHCLSKPFNISEIEDIVALALGLDEETALVGKEAGQS